MIDLWKKGSFDELTNECHCIQRSTHLGSDQSQDVAYLFDHPPSEGKVGATLLLLTTTHKGGVAIPPVDYLVPSGFNSSGSPLFKSTKEILQEKASPGKGCYSIF